MAKRILFTPVGGTDPMKYFRDGSILHICRHYRPDIIYMYLSHEILEYHRRDDRYRDAIERLGVHLGKDFEVHIIERDKLIDVQQYDVFYQDFRKEIGKIEQGMDDGDELLLNTSSGTPAMKSALLVIATFAEYRFLPIQVSTPKKQMNTEYESRKDYDPETEWELNEDNEYSAPNRCEEVKSLNLMRMIQTETIKRHVEAYDYAAALGIAENMKNELAGEVVELLRIMDARVKLDHHSISRLSARKNYSVYPIKEGNKQKIFEYALVLQRKIKKQEYADFIRGITPLVVDLLEEILEKRCGIRLDDFCMVSGKDKVPKWDTQKLQAAGLQDCLEQEYKKKGGFKGGPIYSAHIAALIQYKCQDKELIRKVNDMTEIERKVRNIAAHEIVSVTDEWFQNKTGKKAEEIFRLLKILVEKAGINAKREDWQSYDRINEEIVQRLERYV